MGSQVCDPLRNCGPKRTLRVEPRRRSQSGPCELSLVAGPKADALRQSNAAGEIVPILYLAGALACPGHVAKAAIIATHHKRGSSQECLQRRARSKSYCGNSCGNDAEIDAICCVKTKCYRIPMAEGVGFEPTIPLSGIHALQACALVHSATPPCLHPCSEKSGRTASAV